MKLPPMYLHVGMRQQEKCTAHAKPSEPLLEVLLEIWTCKLETAKFEEVTSPSLCSFHEIPMDMGKV